MLKPRPLPPAHKNQLSIPVKSIGFSNDDHIPTFFRNHEITKKRLKPKPAGVFAPALHLSFNQQDDPDNRDMTSSKNSMTSLIHVRGRNSRIDLSDVTLKMEDTPSKSPNPVKDNVNVVSFLTEDPTSSRSYDGRSTAFSPVLECSKYNIIGEPRFRKKRVKRSEWTLPQLGEVKRQAPPDNARHAQTNALDLRSIYDSDSKLHQVPTEVKREDTVILPPLVVGRRREEAESSMDAHSLAEKRLVMNSQHPHTLYTRLLRDHVVLPTSYKPYFRFKQRKHKFVRSLFGPDDIWENNREPVHCSRCIHQSTATLHYCDVLGKRFCRFCSEMTERNFSQAYEGNRLLVPSPHTSPTLHMLKEPSFIGVRKIVITKTTKKVQGQDLETSVSHNSSGR